MRLKPTYSTMKILLTSAALMLAAGCSSHAIQAPQVGEVAGVDIGLLAGQWKGEYNSTVTQRSGAVSFDLNKTTESARGYILMTSHDSHTITQRRGPKEPPTVATVTEEKKTPLTIDFVAAKGGKVSGDVTPYFDPLFKTTVFTTFEGTLSGNRLEGTFTSRIGQTPNAYSGTWWAVREVQ